ncbi:DUF6221 family protein [Streptomyces noursei]
MSRTAGEAASARPSARCELAPRGPRQWIQLAAAELAAWLQQDEERAREVGGVGWECRIPYMVHVRGEDTYARLPRFRNSVCFVASTNDTGVQEYIAHFDPARMLADVQVKRALLKVLLGAQHAVCEDPRYSCAAAVDGGPCGCGRDDLVSRALAVMHQPYRRASDVAA